MAGTMASKYNLTTSLSDNKLTFFRGLLFKGLFDVEEAIAKAGALIEAIFADSAAERWL